MSEPNQNWTWLGLPDNLASRSLERRRMFELQTQDGMTADERREYEMLVQRADDRRRRAAERISFYEVSPKLTSWAADYRHELLERYRRGGK